MELNYIYALSVYKQPFCYHNNKNQPEKFADKEYKNLDNILDNVKNILNNKTGDDEIYAKVLISFLMFPSYFSISDYSTIALSFKRLDNNIIEKVANNNSFPLIIYAYITSKISSLGLHNFINLFLLLPEISKNEVTDNKGNNIYDHMVKDIYYPEIVYGFSYTFGSWIKNILNDKLYEQNNDYESDDSEIIIYI
mgnify:CR=1 FL=1